MSAHGNASATRRGAASPRHGRLDERGIALPMAMIFVALLTTLMLSFAVLSQTEAVIGSNHMLATQARTQAESGFERAVWALSQGVLNPGATGSLASPLPSPVPGPYDGATFVQSGATGGFLVAIENVSNLERRVRSQGCVPNCTAGARRGHRLIEAIVERFPDLDLDTPCALCVRGQVSIGGNALVTALTDTSCGNKKGAVAADAINISGSADVYGADGNTTANQGTDLAANQTDPTTFDGVTLTPKHFEKLREISKLNGTYFGPGYPNGTPATSPSWTGAVTFNSSNKLKDGIVFIDSVDGQDVTATTDPANIANVLIHGNPFISSEFTGWVIVNGSLTISGSMKINGLVYTNNDFTYNGTGTGQISGLVVSQNKLDTVGTSIADDSSSTGNSRIKFDCAATRNANFVPQGFFLQPGTYREVEGQI